MAGLPRRIIKVPALLLLLSVSSPPFLPPCGSRRQAPRVARGRESLEQMLRGRGVSGEGDRQWCHSACPRRLLLLLLQGAGGGSEGPAAGNSHRHSRRALAPSLACAYMCKGATADGCVTDARSAAGEASAPQPAGNEWEFQAGRLARAPSLSGPPLFRPFSARSTRPSVPAPPCPSSYSAAEEGGVLMGQQAKRCMTWGRAEPAGGWKRLS